MQKDIEVNGKKFTIRELLAKEVDDINFDNKKEALQKQVMMSTGISLSDYENLTLRERLAIFKAINEVNGIEDFQNPAK